MDPLQQFYENKAVRESVQLFFHEVLKELALEKLFSNQEAKDVASAKEVVERAFIKLKELYEPTQKANITNQAR